MSSGSAFFERCWLAIIGRAGIAQGERFFSQRKHVTLVSVSYSRV
jgi:hypothetical protein